MSTTPDLYTVNRTQDGAEVRRELPLAIAQAECNILNAQARMQVGLTNPIHDQHGNCIQQATPIYGSMFQGQIAQYEVRSQASGLVVA